MILALRVLFLKDLRMLRPLFSQLFSLFLPAFDTPGHSPTPRETGLKHPGKEKRAEKTLKGGSLFEKVF